MVYRCGCIPLCLVHFRFCEVHVQMTPTQFFEVLTDPFYTVFTNVSLSDNFVQLTVLLLTIIGGVGLLYKLIDWR